MPTKLLRAEKIQHGLRFLEREYVVGPSTFRWETTQIRGLFSWNTQESDGFSGGMHQLRGVFRPHFEFKSAMGRGLAAVFESSSASLPSAKGKADPRLGWLRRAACTVVAVGQIWGFVYCTLGEKPLGNDPWFKITRFYPEMCLHGGKIPSGCIPRV